MNSRRLRNRARNYATGLAILSVCAECDLLAELPIRVMRNSRMVSTDLKRRLPVGAEVLPEAGVDFRVWAPRCQRLEVVLEQANDSAAGLSAAVVELRRETNGYFSGLARTAREGMRYRFRLDGKAELRPDPASRFQP